MNTSSERYAWIDAFIIDLRHRRRASENTVRGYMRDLVQFAEFLERNYPELGWEAVQPGVIRAFLAELHRLALSPRSIERKIAALRAFFRYLRHRGITASNPAQAVTAPRHDQQLPKVLAQQEVERLLTAPQGEDPLSIRDRAILELLYASGMRVGELTSLRLQDIDWSQNAIQVTGKGNKTRVVLFGRAAQEALSEYLNLLSPRVKAEREGQRRGLAVLKPSRNPPDRTQCAPGAGPLRTRAVHRLQTHPPLSTPLLRHAPAGQRRRPSHCAGAARSRQPDHHPDLHPRQPPAA